MAEYIEREAAYYDFENCNAENPKWTPSRVKALIARQSAADVSPVVRCKDCKHWKKGDFQAGDDTNHLQYGGRCPLCRFASYENDFCSYGERKEGADNG